MKTEIPEQLKKDVPATTWGKILSATPVVMAVIATMLAGLSSSEMTRAQYDRSLAAQQQSKAGDQWSFFQAKRLRGAMQRSTIDVLAGVATARPLDAAGLPGQSAEIQAALLQAELPPLPVAKPLPTELQTALTALEHGQPEPEILAALAQVNEAELATALREARDRAQTYDATLKPINDRIEQLEASLSSADPETRRGFSAARLRYNAARYDAEARLNQAVASFYELQVRQSNVTAERHHRRSQKFFFGMLAAQAGVIISTFSLAARQRSLLWSLAAAAGLAAVAFAIYVYIFI